MGVEEQRRWAAPTYDMNIGGVGQLTHDEPGGMDYTMVEDHIDMIGVAEMSFKAPEGGQGGSQTPWDKFQMGADVEMSLGGSARKAFKGTIIGTKHGHAKGRDTLTLKCMDPLAKVMASRSTQTFEGKTDADIVNEILGKYGAVGTIDSTEGENPYAFQRNESDYHYLRRLAARNGYILTANEGKIDFKKPQFGGGQEITRDQVISLDYNQSTRQIPQNVKVIGWDYNTKKKVEAQAGAGDIQGIGGGQNMVAGGGQTFAGDAVISDVWVNSQEAAKRMATAEMNRLARMGVQGRATVMGSGDLHGGKPVNFADQKAGFNPEVFTVSSRHRVSNKSGFVSELTFCGNTKPK
ncbi:MAG: phage late control D family protein [Alphaproteobacteria bacterium]|nr:phage late control D family protein [Alphaproteobacteria bacterium]